MKTAKIMAAATAVLLALTGCSSSEQGADDSAGETKEMTLISASSVPSITTEVAVYAVPKALGYFEEEGLDVEMITADGSTAAIQALAGGSGDVSFPEGSAVVAAAETNVPVKGFAGIVRQWQWQMAVQPSSDVEEISDLKGKRIGVISLASGSYMFSKAAVKAAGLDPESDVEYVPVGFGAPAVEALENGDVDAVALYSTLYTQLEAEGDEFKLLPNPSLFDDLTGLVWAAKESSLQDDPEALAAFARAAYKGVVFSLANPEAAVEIAYDTWPDLKPAADKADAQLAIDIASLNTEIGSYVIDEEDRSTWTDWGQVDTPALELLRDYAREGGLVTEEVAVDSFWDGSIVDQIGEIDVEAIAEEAEAQ